MPRTGSEQAVGGQGKAGLVKGQGKAGSHAGSLARLRFSQALKSVPSSPRWSYSSVATVSPHTGLSSSPSHAFHSVHRNSSSRMLYPIVLKLAAATCAWSEVIRAL